MMARFDVLLLALFAAISAAVAQPADPLPSWNESAAKKAITDFVARVATQGDTYSDNQTMDALQKLRLTTASVTRRWVARHAEPIEAFIDRLPSDDQKESAP